VLGSIGIRNGRIVFFPCALKRPFLARPRKLPLGRPPRRFGLTGAGRSSPVRSTAIEAAMDAARTTEKEYDNGNHRLFHRFRQWLHRHHQDSQPQRQGDYPHRRAPSDKGPDYRILAGATEFGAAWKKTSNEGRDYLSVKLDDPSFPTPIYATLIEVEGEEGLSLIWSRSNRD
jgi:hypothetical protein